jgi:hypothetical protein
MNNVNVFKLEHLMKKGLLAFRVAAISFILICLAAQSAGAESLIKGLELGGSGKFEFALGDLSKHEVGNAGLSVDCAWPLPLGLHGSVISDIGLNADAGVLMALGKEAYINSWWIFEFGLGAYMDLKINPTIIIRPELMADFRLNLMRSDACDIHDAMLDAGVKTGVVMVTLFGQNGRITFGVDYSILPEQSGICHYITVKSGMSYRFD